MREIGPGRLEEFEYKSRQYNYAVRNGDLKLVANLEYRTPLFGNLEGAVFLDAGNIWRLNSDELISIDEYTGGYDEDGNYISPEEEYESEKILFDKMQFKFSKFFDDLALGTGIGLRYNLGFLVIRLDWGIALHFPYDTGKSGYFNIPSFKKANTIHFAIGYPF